jgi:hypothetical protein
MRRLIKIIFIVLALAPSAVCVARFLANPKASTILIDGAIHAFELGIKVADRAR